MKHNITFAVAASVGSVVSKPDGAIIMMGRVARSGDYDYFGFEVPGSEERGFRWDAKLTGRVAPSELPKIANQMKGLPVTDGHWFVPVGERAEYSVGTVLGDGTVTGEWIDAEHLIHDPKAILKITQEKAVELSIGALSSFRWSNGDAGEPDFYIEDVEMDHVALVEEGRAGPEGRLLNHKAKLEKDQTMKTITINGQTFQVDDAVALEYQRLTSAETDLKTQLTNASTQTKAAQDAAVTVTAERDAARGQLAVANAQVTTITNAQPDTQAEAVRIANAHTEFVDEATRLGHDGALALGSYDQRALQITILNTRGIALAQDASDDHVKGAWGAALTFAAANPAKTSILDSAISAPLAGSPSDRANASIAHSYFKGPKPVADKTTEGSAV